MIETKEQYHEQNLVATQLLYRPPDGGDPISVRAGYPYRLRDGRLGCWATPADRKISRSLEVAFEELEIHPDIKKLNEKFPPGSILKRWEKGGLVDYIVRRSFQVWSTSIMVPCYRVDKPGDGVVVPLKELHPPERAAFYYGFDSPRAEGLYAALGLWGDSVGEQQLLRPDPAVLAREGVGEDDLMWQIEGPVGPECWVQLRWEPGHQEPWVVRCFLRFGEDGLPTETIPEELQDMFDPSQQDSLRALGRWRHHSALLLFGVRPTQQLDRELYHRMLEEELPIPAMPGEEEDEEIEFIQYGDQLDIFGVEGDR